MHHMVVNFEWWKLKKIKTSVVQVQVDYQTKEQYMYFLNQQFIIWGTVAYHGSYFVTTYIKMHTT